MKKQLFFGFILAAFLLTPSALLAQSTEGTDFWVTFMRSADDSPETLWLTFSAKEDVTIHVKNDYTGYETSLDLPKDSIRPITIPSSEYRSCYVGNDDNEIATNKALHIWSDTVNGELKNFSVIAANYRDMSFDAAAIIPTKALRSEHYIECYTPTVHEGSSQGTHFAIVATEDNTIVDYYTTATTSKGNGGSITDTLTTPVLMRGQVFYVWTGAYSGEEYDLTGSWVRARNKKAIAVFNGNPHTNIPDGLRDRDHIYSQAMPVEYWGTKFAITSSLTTIDNNKKNESERIFLPGVWERIDKVRVMALVDQTVVYLDGDSVYTIDFAKDTKHYYEFDFGALDKLSTYDRNNHDNRNSDFHEGSSHFLETSCPAAVHLLLTSNRYDHDGKGNLTVDGTSYKYEYCNGDPTLIWINPIEQTINDLTFGTFQTTRVKDHFVNIVTRADNVKSFLLDSLDATARFGVDSIYKKFDTIPGNKEYMFARLKIDNGTHHMTSDSGFIAHVYGFGLRESYGYPAGGNTKDLSATLYINDEPYSASSDNKLCGDKSVLFECRLGYKPDSLYWSFGDGTDSILVDVDSVRHFYDVGDRGNVTFEAYVLIYHEIGLKNECIEWSNNTYDSIHFHVNVGMPRIDVKNIDIPRCIDLGTATDIKIILDNPAKVDLTGDSVKITFTQAALNAGFKNEEIRTQGDTMLIVHVPEDTPDRTKFNMHIHIGSECESTVFDKDIEFHMEYAIKLLEQRYKNVLGLIRDSFATKEVRDFVWFHNGDTVPNQQTSILYLDETNPQNSGEYYVCYIVKEEGKEELKECTCPITFEANGKSHSFTDQTTVGAYSIEGNKIFVNADWKGKTDIECYAQWYDVSGRTESAWKFNVPDGGCTIPTPDAKGFYILRVVTDGAARSFKIFINH